MAKPDEGANRALAAMRAYTGDDKWELLAAHAGTDLVDLIADLMHLVKDAAGSAGVHFRIEVKVEEG